MPETLKVLRRENTGVIYASPTKPDLTVRFRNNASPKTLNGVSTTNFLSEVIVNETNSVTVGGQPANDAISIRLRVSGAKESDPRVGVLLTALAAQYPTWHTEGVFKGFDPETAPVI